MSYVFPDGGLILVPTGSLGIAFRADGSPLPELIEISVTDESLVETIYTTDLISTPDATWQVARLTPPLSFGQDYAVDVLFDSVSVYTEEITVPLPGKARSRVLRQRLYEVLLAGVEAGDIDASIYGSGHYPGTVNNDFKAEAGIVVELAPAYTGAMELHGGIKVANMAVTVPINIYGGMDEGEDAEEVATEFERIAGYLLGKDWKLSGFGMHQSNAVFEGGAPDINSDRMMVIIRGNLTMTMRSVL